MDDKKEPFEEVHAPVPFYAHEAEVVRLERNNRRVWILCIVIFLALILTNAGWIYYENQYEDITVSQDVDTGEGDAVVSGVGDIYGEGQADG